jgi:hypothetical protein
MIRDFLAELLPAHYLRLVGRWFDKIAPTVAGLILAFRFTDWRWLAAAIPIAAVLVAATSPRLERKRQTYRIGKRFHGYIQGAQSRAAPLDGAPSTWFPTPTITTWRRTPNDLAAAVYRAAWWNLRRRLTDPKRRPKPRPARPKVDVLELTVALGDHTDPVRFRNLRGTLAADYKAKDLTVEPVPGDSAERYRLTIIWRDRLLEPVPWTMPDHPRPGRLKVGVTRHGDLWLKLVGSHCLIGGATDMGKSSIVHSFAAQLIAAGVRAVGLDGKGGVELGVWKRHLDVYARTPDEILKALIDLGHNLERRESEMEAHGIRNAGDRPDLWPYTVVFVDEVASIVEMSPDKADTKRLIQLLTQRGRSAGISLIYSTQHPEVDVLTTGTKGNIRHRIGLRCEQGEQADAIAPGLRGQGVDLSKLPAIPGRLVYKNGVEWRHGRAAGLFGQQLDDVAADLYEASRPPVEHQPSASQAIALGPVTTQSRPLHADPTPLYPSADGPPSVPPVRYADEIGVRRQDLRSRLSAVGSVGLTLREHQERFALKKDAATRDFHAVGAWSNGARWFAESVTRSRVRSA